MEVYKTVGDLPEGPLRQLAEIRVKQWAIKNSRNSYRSSAPNDTKNIQEADLNYSIRWADTPEGHPFWENLNTGSTDNLAEAIKIAEAALSSELKTPPTYHIFN